MLLKKLNAQQHDSFPKTPPWRGYLFDMLYEMVGRTIKRLGYIRETFSFYERAVESHSNGALVTDAVLGLEADQRPVMFMAVGYSDPDGMVAYSQKKPNRQICQFNVT